MPPGIKSRLFYLRLALSNKWLLIVGGIWTLFGTFTTIRDNFLPLALQQSLATPALLNHLGWRDYVIGLLLILFGTLWEGAYQITDVSTARLLKRHSDQLAEKDAEITRLTSEIGAMRGQLAGPSIVPEITKFSLNEIPPVNPMVNFGPSSLLSIDPNTTEVRIELKLSNENRTKATIQECELVLDPETSYLRRYQPNSTNPLDTKTPIEYGCPRTCVLFFTLSNMSIRSLVRRRFEISVKDGAGNIRVSDDKEFF